MNPLQARYAASSLLGVAAKVGQNLPKIAQTASQVGEIAGAVGQVAEAGKKVRDVIQPPKEADEGEETTFSLPSNEAEVSPAKALKILQDGTVHGKPITDKQRGMFGAIAGKKYDLAQYGFDESLHPRDEGGQFAPKGQAGGGGVPPEEGTAAGLPATTDKATQHAKPIGTIKGPKRFQGAKTVGDLVEAMTPSESLSLKRYGDRWQAEIRTTKLGKVRLIATAAIQEKARGPQLTDDYRKDPKTIAAIKAGEPYVTLAEYRYRDQDVNISIDGGKYYWDAGDERDMSGDGIAYDSFAEAKNAATKSLTKQPAAKPPEKPAEEPGFKLKREPAKRAKGFETTGKGKQQALFGKAGKPGQKNLFADVAVPDDMVNPELPKEPPKKKAQRKLFQADVVSIPPGALGVDTTVDINEGAGLADAAMFSAEAFTAAVCEQYARRRATGGQKGIEGVKSDVPRQGKFDWITIGGDKSAAPGFKGGTPVMIDDAGNIKAGPKGLEGKSLKSLDRNVAGTEKDKRKDNVPPGPPPGQKESKPEKKPEPSPAAKAAGSDLDKAKSILQQRRDLLDRFEKGELTADEYDEQDDKLAVEHKKALRAAEGKIKPTPNQIDREAKKVSGFKDLPKGVQDFVRRQADALDDVATQLQRAEDLDDRLGGGGRYAADTWNNIGASVASAHENLDKFRKIAKENDIDPEAILDELGLADPQKPADFEEWYPSEDEPAEAAAEDTTETPGPEPATPEAGAAPSTKEEPGQATGQAQTTEGRPTNLADAWRESERREDEGFSESQSTRQYADRFISTIDNNLPEGTWKQTKDLEKGPYTRVSRGTIGRDLSKMAKKGLLQIAWDKDGYPHYAKPGAEVPDNLATQDEIDAAGGEFPTGKGEKEPEPKPQAKPKAPRKKPTRPRTTAALREAAAGVVGGDKRDQDLFIDMVKDYHKTLRDTIESRNEAFLNVLGNFGIRGRKVGLLIANARRAGDPDKLGKHFDEIVESAARDYPEALANLQGQSERQTDDPEQALFQRIINGGVEKIPPMHDQSVIDAVAAQLPPDWKPFAEQEEETEPESEGGFPWETDDFQALPKSLQWDLVRFHAQSVWAERYAA